MNEKLNTDTLVDTLAKFICSDASEDSWRQLTKFKGNEKRVCPGISLPANANFSPMLPTTAYACGFDDERIVTTNPQLLFNPVQDIIGSSSQVAFINPDDGYLRWYGFRRLKKAPRGLWVASRGASLYELHCREVFGSGQSNYAKRLAAVDRNGHPVATAIVGTRDGGGMPAGGLLVIAASAIEDCHRPGVIRATVSDSVGLTLAVPQGEHLDLFRLRDGPYSGSRKRPLLHWVAKHMRRTSSKPCEVASHLRGVHKFQIDGMNVELEAK